MMVEGFALSLYLVQWVRKKKNDCVMAAPVEVYADEGRGKKRMKKKKRKEKGKK